MSTEPTESLSPSAPWRAWLRAVLLTLLVALNAVAALPTLGTASAERLQRPFEQAELGRWQALLQRLGVEVSLAQLTAWYLQYASSLAEVRAVVLSPLSGWLELTQTSQAWPLFGTPDSFSPAFRLQAWDAQGERVLYESGDAERDWQGSLLGYRRMRASYNASRSGPPSTFAGVCQRLSERLFAEQAEVQRVRCAIVRRDVPVPGEAARREPEEQHALDIARPPG